jgi:hypothetical protein
MTSTAESNYENLTLEVKSNGLPEHGISASWIEVNGERHKVRDGMLCARVSTTGGAAEERYKLPEGVDTREEAIQALRDGEFTRRSSGLMR